MSLYHVCIGRWISSNLISNFHRISLTFVKVDIFSDYFTAYAATDWLLSMESTTNYELLIEFLG